MSDNIVITNKAIQSLNWLIRTCAHNLDEEIQEKAQDVFAAIRIAETIPTPSPVDCRDVRAEFENEFAGKISLVKSGDFPETYSENLSQMLWISWQAAWNAAKGEGK